MENSSAPKCAVADRSDDDREPVRNGIGVDGAWKHQRLREGTSGSRPTRAREFPIQSLAVLVSFTIT
jgi:hypothetical protein